MPTYEMPILYKIMSRPELVSTLKRTAQVIFDKGGIFRKLENLGTRDMPYKHKAHDQVHKRASYFLMEFDVPATSVDDIKEEYSRDVDIVRVNMFRVQEAPKIECTLADEILPPAYRKDVQELIDLGKKKYKPKFEHNTGLTYYPFQK